jgi:hypothetical protein
MQTRSASPCNFVHTSSEEGEGPASAEESVCSSSSLSSSLSSSPSGTLSSSSSSSTNAVNRVPCNVCNGARGAMLTLRCCNEPVCLLCAVALHTESDGRCPLCDKTHSANHKVFLSTAVQTQTQKVCLMCAGLGSVTLLLLIFVALVFVWTAIEEAHGQNETL